MERVTQIASHLSGKSSGRDKLLQKQDDDVVICAAVRTPLTKARKGGLSNTSTDVLLATVLKEVIQRAQIDPALVEDVMCMFCSLWSH